MHRSDGGGGRWAAPIGLAVIVVVLAAGAAVIRAPAAPRADAAAPAPVVGSPVVASPLRGPPRTITGPAYAAYLAEGVRLGSLPPGAVWPVGAPAGLDAGVLPDAAGRSAAAAAAAQFTWLCAWEWETLAAHAAADAPRLAQADDRLTAFLHRAWTHDHPSSRWWTDVVIGPAIRGDYGGLSYDVPLSCASAGIPVAAPPR